MALLPLRIFPRWIYLRVFDRLNSRLPQVFAAGAPIVAQTQPALLQTGLAASAWRPALLLYVFREEIFV